MHLLPFLMSLLLPAVTLWSPKLKAYEMHEISWEKDFPWTHPQPLWDGMQRKKSQKQFHNIWSIGLGQALWKYISLHDKAWVLPERDSPGCSVWNSWFQFYELYLSIKKKKCCISDLLHSLWPSPGPSMSLQMTQFHSFSGWVIIHCIYVPHLLYPLLCWWTFTWFPCLGYCKLCCHEHWSACIFWNYVFLWVYA